ncbi:hypothetical protein A2473_03825 [candidate division WWE3 bacterium RIFOXYC2_FULL_42_13]|uniref:Uncharacterized protein n=2 Tax=Katanobacteria TaxID=422282 RepID=A0A0G1EN12_UNCKA|nr:MAG: hypothetical protein UV89_C0015G0005 [candidate division WWE3 bacterium GW2011_GWB2_43_22]OGC58556.1 MAG: hypothetical protein A2245_04350 [candidate division WWE3 bacterium RIFOXYA2_FULL_43_12]OGC64165.1 MAG: hypothetical protein A2274_00480 [candidate division WWE3 bacterium RIFOXYA12_FULL_43_11]OGC71602.1 MAG: hypothetical protein A2337_01545 [candidate division WWE3 bacterium RIFOXYB2_FULL_43_9]OGC72847.1 MAG: hypothetical protein A2473_03825 [candidate division WWE3 bacterium RIFOX
MSDLQPIVRCVIGVPSSEKKCEDNTKHLVKIAVTLSSPVLTKEMLFYIQATKNESKWELHSATIDKIKGQIKEEGFDPDSFNLELFKCRVRNFLN